MSDPSSGDRWEPTAQQAPPEDAGPVEPPAPPPYDLEAGSRAPDERHRRFTGRAWLGGIAAALFLSGGIGGFLVGHAVADGGGRPGLEDHEGPHPGFGAPVRPGPRGADPRGGADAEGDDA